LARRRETGTREAVAVLGLGRFGSSLALELAQEGVEVLGIDRDERLVQELSHQLTHAAVADTTDEEALRQLGVQEFRKAVVAIGTDLEASILTTAILVDDLRIPSVWAKALTHAHARILRRLGAHHVVLPEQDMGERVAHLVMGRMLDYIEFEDGFALAKTRPPAEAVGRTLGEARLRSKYGVTVVCVKRPGEDFTYATAETLIHQDDLLIIAGKTARVERFAELAPR